MDNQGWIPVAVVANFNRVRMLTPDMMLIIEAVRESPLVEVSVDGAYLRAKGTWDKWILPPQQRDLSHQPVPPRPSGASSAAAASAAASAGSAAAGQLGGGSPVAGASPTGGSIVGSSGRGSVAAAVGGVGAGGLGLGVGSLIAGSAPSIAAAAASRAGAGGRAEEQERDDDELFEMDEEQEAAAAATPGSKAEAGPGSTPGGKGKEQGRGVSDRDIEKLIVLTPSHRRGPGGKLDPHQAKMISDGLAAYHGELRGRQQQHQHQQQHHSHQHGGRSGPGTGAGHRLGSGAGGREHGFYGSSISSSVTRPMGIHGWGRGGKARVPHGESPPNLAFGWLYGTSPDPGAGLMGTSPAGSSYRSSHMLGSSPRNAAAASASLGTSIPKFQHPSHALLEENGFKQMKYAKFYKRCIEERQKQGVGMSEEMNTLFRCVCGKWRGEGCRLGLGLGCMGVSAIVTVVCACYARRGVDVVVGARA